MKKDLNIMMGDLEFVEFPNLEDVDNRTVAVNIDDLRKMTALDERTGRTGYFHVCKDGEERPIVKDFEVFEYEGDFAPVPLCR